MVEVDEGLLGFVRFMVFLVSRFLRSHHHP